MACLLGIICKPWWRHQMQKFSALLPIWAGNSPVTGEFPAQRPVTRSFDVFFDLRLNKRFSKQSWGWWFEMPSHSLWRYCNASVNYVIIASVIGLFTRNHLKHYLHIGNCILRNNAHWHLILKEHLHLSAVSDASYSRWMQLGEVDTTVQCLVVLMAGSCRERLPLDCLGIGYRQNMMSLYYLGRFY